jgi:hypothetical protein
MTDPGPIGSHVLATWHRTLAWAVDEIVRQLSPSQLSKLKVGSGEHLAAIITTAFLHVAPKEVDFSGGTDLLFQIPDGTRQKNSMEPYGVNGDGRAAFEIKSLPGGFREFNARAKPGDQHGAYITSVNDVLRQARPQIEDARAQLLRKTEEGTSRNIFLVVHLLEHPTVECLQEYIIAHHLDPLKDIQDIDTVWVLWVPGHLTLWSAHNNRWTNLIFDATNPGEDLDVEMLTVLQDVEAEYLARVGNSKGSPYVFGLTFGPNDSHDTGTERS